LADLFPDAREHIAVRHEETLRAWNDLLQKSAERKDKVKQADTLQSYFDDYRDLMYANHFSSFTILLNLTLGFYLMKGLAERNDRQSDSTGIGERPGQC
jgi:hypothetical protein